MKAYGGVDVLVYIHIFLTLALAGGVVSFTPRPLYPPPPTHWIGGWVNPRAGLDDVEKKKFLIYRGSNSNPSVVEPIVSHYTDFAIPAP
jgi:hypothetical protein